MTELVSGRGVEVSSACRLFGRSRQAYYRLRACGVKPSLSERSILEKVDAIRSEAPGIGCRKLWLMLCSVFGRERMPGRDRFFRLLRRRGLVLARPKPRRTTDSNHRYHKWKNLVRGFTPTAANQLWVADITYIPLECGGTCYLHLVTDAYSHKVVGHKVSPSLRASESLDALRQAIAHAVAVRGTDRLDGLVHHSDRGVQYCCDAYIGELGRHGISVSMTEDYNPTDNAVAERVNGRYIDFYNTRRPHMSIGNNTPETAHAGSGEQKRLWKRKKRWGMEKMTMEDSIFAAILSGGPVGPPDKDRECKVKRHISRCDVNHSCTSIQSV